MVCPIILQVLFVLSFPSALHNFACVIHLFENEVVIFLLLSGTCVLCDPFSFPPFLLLKWSPTREPGRTTCDGLPPQVLSDFEVLVFDCASILYFFFFLA